METKLIKDEEVERLLMDLFEVHGYDFTDYSRASLNRRITRLMGLGKIPSFAELRYLVRNDPEYLKKFVEQITVNVTEMFRDPEFYQAIRTQVIPVLATYPLIRIWHAGSSTGEEVFSVAILLKEAGLLHKSLLYATDINPGVLESARKGIIRLGHMKQYSENYIRSGGKEDFSSYYTASYDRAKIQESLLSKIIFATHNLVSDRSFNEFQLILCRNTLIYFDKDLQEKVFRLFDDSLENLGFIGLGAKETLRFSSIASRYKQIGREKLWRKIQ